MNKDELHPLSHYATNRRKLVDEAFTVLHGQRLQAAIPPSLRGIDYTELKSLCLEELRKIDTLRIVDVIEGRVKATSKNETSSSHQATADKQQVKRRKRPSGSEPSIAMSELKKKIKKVIHEDLSTSKSDKEEETQKAVLHGVKKKNKDKKKKHSTSNKSPASSIATTPKKVIKKVKVKNGEKVKVKKVKKLKKEKKAEKIKVKKKTNQEKVSAEKPAIPGQRTLMELLELEYRAKAIKALLKFQGFNATKIDDVFIDSDSPESNPKTMSPVPSTSVPKSDFALQTNIHKELDCSDRPDRKKVTKHSVEAGPVTEKDKCNVEQAHEKDEELTVEQLGKAKQFRSSKSEETGENCDDVSSAGSVQECEKNSPESSPKSTMSPVPSTSINKGDDALYTDIHEELDYGDGRDDDGEELTECSDQVTLTIVEDKFDVEQAHEKDKELTAEQLEKDEQFSSSKSVETGENCDDVSLIDSVQECEKNSPESSPKTMSPVPSTSINKGDDALYTDIHEELDYGDGRDGDGEELTEYPDEATPITWYERWYSSKKVQKVMNSNKMYGKVRHKLKVKQAHKKEKEMAAEQIEKDKQLKGTKSGAVSENCDDIPLIGSIQEYEKLFGKKICTPSQNESAESTSKTDEEDDKRSPVKTVAAESDGDDNELWGDILGNA